MKAKPFVKWVGGKTQLIDQLEAMLPADFDQWENVTYIEPFVGGGAMLFYMLQTHSNIQSAVINDINEDLTTCYKVVKHSPQLLVDSLAEIQKEYYSLRSEDSRKQFFMLMRAEFNTKTLDPIRNTTLFFFLNRTCFNGLYRVNKSGLFNVPFGRYQNLNTHILTEEHCHLLQGAEIHNTDYAEIFNMAQPNDFIFLDPPYDCAFSDYGNEEYKDGFNEDSHRRLAQDFRNLPCPAMMIIGRTDLTTELYGDLVIDEYKKSYSVNIRNRFKAAATHIVVCNYQP